MSGEERKRQPDPLADVLEASALPQNMVRPRSLLRRNLKLHKLHLLRRLWPSSASVADEALPVQEVPPPEIPKEDANASSEARGHAAGTETSTEVLPTPDAAEPAAYMPGLLRCLCNFFWEFGLFKGALSLWWFSAVCRDSTERVNPLQPDCTCSSTKPSSSCRTCLNAAKPPRGSPFAGRLAIVVFSRRLGCTAGDSLQQRSLCLPPPLWLSEKHWNRLRAARVLSQAARFAMSNRR